jgi:hypothetical protein
VKVQFFRLKDDNVRAATGFVVATTWSVSRLKKA